MKASRCGRHGLATGPGGLCALCQRDLHAGEGALIRRRDKPLRTFTRIAVAIAAGITTFGLLLAIFDKADSPPSPAPGGDAASE